MSILPKTFNKSFHDEESVKKMKYSKLGRTNLKISQISFGGGTLSSLYGFVTLILNQNEKWQIKI